MILTRQEILHQIKKRRIEISPFKRSSLCANSYGFHLGKEIVEFPINHEANPGDGTTSLIPSEGIYLFPGRLYLGVTKERVSSKHYVQFLYGNRSLGSLGIWVHITAPIGHCGSAICWTLEIRVLRPVRIYSGMPFGKILFLTTGSEISRYGSIEYPLSGKYLESKIQQCAKYPEF